MLNERNVVYWLLSMFHFEVAEVFLMLEQHFSLRLFVRESVLICFESFRINLNRKKTFFFAFCQRVALMFCHLTTTSIRITIRWLTKSFFDKHFIFVSRPNPIDSFFLFLRRLTMIFSVVFFLLFSIKTISTFYIPGVAPQNFRQTDFVEIKVKKLEKFRIDSFFFSSLSSGSENDEYQNSIALWLLQHSSSLQTGRWNEIQIGKSRRNSSRRSNCQHEFQRKTKKKTNRSTLFRLGRNER